MLSIETSLPFACEHSCVLNATCCWCLQPSWDYLFQCADIAEETLEQHMPKNPDLHGSPNSSPRAGAGGADQPNRAGRLDAAAVAAAGAGAAVADEQQQQTVFGSFVEKASGVLADAPDPQQYRHLACIMDGFVSFKLW
eukprot:SAG22_NODE_2753_length_2248_cov_1.772452_2_plen_139_part_00